MTNIRKIANYPYNYELEDQRDIQNEFAEQILSSLSGNSSKLDYMTKLLETYISNKSKVVYVNDEKENDKVITQKEMILHKLDELSNKLEDNYDDISERLEIFCLIKSNIKQLKTLISKNKNIYYYRLCIMLHNSIDNIKSEDLSIEQVKALKYVLSKLNNQDIDRDDYLKVDTILYEKQLDWIPDLEKED